MRLNCRQPSLCQVDAVQPAVLQVALEGYLGSCHRILVPGEAQLLQQNDQA